MGALDRFVDVLRLFDERKSDWTIQDMAEATGVAASTVYRTVRALVSQGFLDPSTEAHYRLGAVFIEFDRRMRLSDPLIREGAPVLADLLSVVSVPSTAIIARLYGDQVICVAEERNGSLAMPTSYERGRPMPLLQGVLLRRRFSRNCRAPGLCGSSGPMASPTACSTRSPGELGNPQARLHCHTWRSGQRAGRHRRADRLSRGGDKCQHQPDLGGSGSGRNARAAPVDDLGSRGGHAVPHTFVEACQLTVDCQNMVRRRHEISRIIKK